LEDLYPTCRYCEAWAICDKTEDSCDAYYNFYELDKQAREYAALAGGQAVCVKEKPARVESLDYGGWLNKMEGEIVNIIEGDHMAQVTIKSGDNYISSVMPIQEFKNRGHKKGDTVQVVIKAVNVVIMR